ncbi:hypothetical protein ANTPLA_LOCUS3872 [Anthophora plagiata]
MDRKVAFSISDIVQRRLISLNSPIKLDYLQHSNRRNELINNNFIVETVEVNILFTLKILKNVCYIISTL